MKSTISLWLLLASPLAMAADGPRAPVVEDATLYGSPLQLVAPAPIGEDHNVNACVAVGYTVKPDGALGEFEVVDAWSGKPPASARLRLYWENYGKIAAQAVQVAQTKVRMQAPAEMVRTVSRVSFGPDAAEDNRCMVRNAHDSYAAADDYRLNLQVVLKEARALRVANEGPNVRFDPAPKIPGPPPPSPSPKPQSSSGSQG
ncbi:hypothetical protein [Solilutibacter silvestris]|uniref:Uncharacterized protein n=1 Tax=Solilutibacter silvestris TaxID=1645665 RepID=A0A2K1PX62_9GAMM|nr:hypothetical protein [Lysobacter silvestris]PNS07371.1 hypothetical protein Lysil_1547 [Lysobacter silvestris]